MRIVNRLAERFAPVKPLPEGIHHAQVAPKDKPPYRLHLRMRNDGTGILVVNAATVLQLNETAAEYAYHFIKGTSPEETAKAVASRYQISKGIALEDYLDFTGRIETLIETPDLDPVTFLDFERVAPHSADLTAPLRLDCALTYRLPAGAHADDAPAKRVERELTTAEWLSVLDKAWQAGVPHVTFTGGEPTLRDDLPALIERAEQNGQVCGLLTDGLRLADKTYFDKLLQTGLDHLLFLLQPENETSWHALETIMPEDIFVTVHLTVTSDNAQNANACLERLAKLGVKSLSLSFAADLGEIQHALRNTASDLGLTLTFDLPVPYSGSNPVALETAEDEVPAGAGRAWLYVEPDGDVLPSQGMADRILGNILRDHWQAFYPAS
jgi:hypothetical protein